MSTTFKQYWLPEKKGFDSLQLRDVPKGSPKLGQILVRIKAVSLNWRDGIVAIGTYPFPGPDALVPGSDGAGVIEEIGEGVTEWKVGDRVLANFTQDHIARRLTREVGLTQLGGEQQGLLGEFFIFPKTGVVKIPDYLSFEEASCLPCAALTAWNALYGLTPVRPGQTVLLQGTGGVSTFALQISHAAGAKTIVTSSSDEKLAKAKDLGATHGINYRTTPDWAAEAMKITTARVSITSLKLEEHSHSKRPLTRLASTDRLIASGISRTPIHWVLEKTFAVQMQPSLPWIVSVSYEVSL
ncbi:hypothetical protein BFJ70_g15724 [Fusarium oxysporum]|nr:hypothetical protein BFJ70_g15724 [Fusarium oxysporum]